MFYKQTKNEKIYPVYVSKHNSQLEKQYSFSKLEKHPAVIKLSALLSGITAKHKGGFYCLNCFHLFRTRSKLKSHKNVY